MTKHIFVVDDDALMRRSLVFHMEEAGYHTQEIDNAEDAIAAARRSPPDLILLDIGLPGMDGLDALRILRDQLAIPVILLTARRRELDQVLGLELGADDYVTKPFAVDVLLARIKNVLRRRAPTLPTPKSSSFVVGGVTIDLAGHTVTVDGTIVDVPPRAFDVLVTLAQSAGQVVSVEELLNRVWGAGFEGEPQVVYVHIRWLREKIEKDPNHPQRLLTMRGVGYKLVP